MTWRPAVFAAIPAGRRLLVGRPVGDREFEVWIAEWNDRTQVWVADDGLAVRGVTHWTELPDPPQEGRR